MPHLLSDKIAFIRQQFAASAKKRTAQKLDGKAAPVRGFFAAFIPPSVAFPASRVSLPIYLFRKHR
jgi:hypothetical protein